MLYILDIIRVPLLTGHFSCPLASCNKQFKMWTVLKSIWVRVTLLKFKLQHTTMNAIKHEKRKMMSPSFDLKTGSQLALASNEQTAYHHTMAINCSPIAMHLNHHSLTSSISIHALMRKEFRLDVVGKIPFPDNCFSDSLESVLQLHDENGQGVQSSTEPSIAGNNVYVEKSTASSRLPGLIDTFAFTEATTEVIECLNLDFRLSPSLLHAVAALHTGCVIVDEYNLVFMLTAEVYSRSKSLDAHAKTNLKSIPLPCNATYDGLAIGIYKESDGGAAKKKLKIGSKSMNVLITMLTDVPKNEASIGP